MTERWRARLTSPRPGRSRPSFRSRPASKLLRIAAQTFKAAVEASDVEAICATLAPDVVFRSPVVYKPYHGREAVSRLLEAVVRVFEDFCYVDRLERDGREVLIFRARVGDRELDGLDLLTYGPDGLVSELTVMVRPLSAAIALAEAMGSQLAEQP